MKKTMVIFLSLLLLSTMFGCSTINSPTAQGHTSSYQSSSGSTENETSKQNSSVMSVASESSEIATVSLSEEVPDISSSSVTWVCPNPNAHYGTCTNQESHNRLVVALTEARNQASSAATSSATVSQRQPTEYKTQEVQFQGETVTIEVMHTYGSLGNEYYAEPNPWRGPNGERLRINQQTGEASLYIDDCGKPYGNGHGGTCLHIFSKGHFNCDDTSKTCPYCGRHFGNGYNGTCYLTRAEEDKIYCYHYDEGLRYNLGKNPEPI